MPLGLVLLPPLNGRIVEKLLDLLNGQTVQICRAVDREGLWLISSDLLLNRIALPLLLFRVLLARLGHLSVHRGLRTDEDVAIVR